MLAEGGGYPVDGGLQSCSKSKAQGFIRRVAQTARRLHRLTRGVRELEVTVHSLQHKPYRLWFRKMLNLLTKTKQLQVSANDYSLVSLPVLTSCRESMLLRMLGNVVCTTPYLSSEYEAATR